MKKRKDIGGNRNDGREREKMREREIEEGNKREEREGCGDLKKDMGGKGIEGEEMKIGRRKEYGTERMR